MRVAIPLAGFNLSGGVKSLVGVANALADRGHAVRFLVPEYAATPPTPLRPGVEPRILKAGPTWLPAPLRKLIHLGRLAMTATAGADLCLANYFTTAYVAVASKRLRRDRTVLAYNVRGFEPLSHGLNADASLPSRLVRAALAWGSYRLPLQKICTTDWLRQQIGDPTAFVVGHGIDLAIFHPPPDASDGPEAEDAPRPRQSVKRPPDAPAARLGYTDAAGRRTGDASSNRIRACRDEQRQAVDEAEAPGSAGPARAGMAPRPLVVGTIGRLGVAKGYPDFLRAVEYLPPDLSIEIKIAAPDDVPLPTRFATTVERPRPEHEMADFYRRCDLFVFSSRGEGFGLPALEAMAVGCPLVTTDSGGVRQFAEDGINCVMTPPADPPALARAIEALARDPARLAALRAAGLMTAAAYGQDAVLDRFCRHLVSLVSAGRARPGRPRPGRPRAGRPRR